MARRRNVFDSIFHKVLDERLEKEINTLCLQLGDGMSLDLSDVSATAYKYAAVVQRIQTLRDVLEICNEIEQELIRSG